MYYKIKGKVLVESGVYLTRGHETGRQDGSTVQTASHFHGPDNDKFF
jgi:hypothetical protein